MSLTPISAPVFQNKLQETKNPTQRNYNRNQGIVSTTISAAHNIAQHHMYACKPSLPSPAHIASTTHARFQINKRTKSHRRSYTYVLSLSQPHTSRSKSTSLLFSHTTDTHAGLTTLLAQLQHTKALSHTPFASSTMFAIDASVLTRASTRLRSG